ncbi:hypothetical protein FACS1894192_03630 [Bacilli bacterium]|nr:hypothetical protein FACS1894192_03630 [Bacilli bacterium]
MRILAVTQKVRMIKLNNSKYKKDEIKNYYVERAIVIFLSALPVLAVIARNLI